MNLWKDIPAGENPPEILNMIVEVASGSRDKYEYDITSGVFFLDRIIPSPVVFPVEYGFVPQTWFKDNDPLDIMALSYEPFKIGCLIKVKVIGAAIIEDEKGEDPKILSIPLNDQRFKGYNDIEDVHPNKLREIQEFFETYKRLEPHKWVKFKEWKNATEAMEIVNQAIEKFKEIFGRQKVF